MTNRNRGGLWLGALVLGAGAMSGGCSAPTTTEDATATVAQVVESASDSSDAVEVSSLLRGLNALRPDAVEGFHCDASPDITSVDVCGKSLPATVHLEWTECAAPGRPGGGGRGGGGHGGGRPPPPPTDGSTRPPPPEGGRGGPRPERGPEADAAKASRPRFGPSSGTVDLVYTYTPPETGCEGAIVQSQVATFSISRTDEEGAVSKVEGTTSSFADLVDGAPPQHKSTESDVTRTLTDASGTVVSSVRLTGNQSVEFSSDTPPVRTLNGSFTEALLDGTQGTVTLANVVRPPRNVCPWPTSGTLTRAASDGTTHVLAFGPDCGAATLDGTAVDLPEKYGHGPGRR